MRLLLTIGLLFVVLSSHAQVSKLDKIFNTYQEAKGVTSIKIGKPMFAMLNNLNINDGDLDQIKPLLKTINSIKMLIIEDDNQPELKDEVKNAFKAINFEELMAIHSDGSQVKFLAEHSQDTILQNLLLDIRSEGSTIFMILDGSIKYEDINKLIEKK